MHVYAVTQLRLRVGSQKPSPKLPPPAWFNLHTETVDYGAATIDLARNNVYFDCNFSIMPGVNNLEDGVIVVCGLPLLKDVYPKSTVSEAIQALKTADGFFAAVGYIPEQEKLSVMTDFMGVMPLFVHQTQEGLEISTSTTGMTTEPDLSAWGALLSMGHSIGERSLARNVRRLLPGVVEYYNASGQTLGSENYWGLPEDGNPPTTSEVAESLRTNARDFSSVIQETSVLLSGGFDSRLILCVLKDIGVDCEAVIVSHRDEHADNDAYLARRIAKKLGVKANYYEPPRDFFSTNEYLSYMQMTDAAIPSLYLFIAQVAGYVPERGVWEGLILGNALKEAFNADANVKNAYLIQKCQDKDSDNWTAARKVFGKDVFESMWSDFNSMISNEINTYSESLDGIWRFVVANRMRHRVAQNPLMAYSCKGIPLLLGSSQEFWSLASSIPTKQRSQQGFYKSLFKQEFSLGAQVPLLSGSTLTNAGEWNLEKGFRGLLGKGHQWIKKRPRKARLLGLDPTGFEYSKLLDHPSLFEPEHKHSDMLNWEAIFKHKERGTLNASDRALLFQWKAWRWVQEGNLFKKLTYFEE